ncbi:hypothetical protein OF83DRAFT_698550 [Amylostereum chailletii]|nr:hypothetical protein OF83DRAFT_698550 [Amylostereum chailletii]
MESVELNDEIQALEASIRSRQTIVRGLEEQRNDTVAAIFKLPVEIIETILEIVQDSPDLVSWMGHVKVPSWTRVTHVCRYWRHVAIGHPRLWTRIATYPEAWTLIFVERSANMPINVTLNLTKQRNAPKALAIILDHCRRTRSLHIEGAHDDISSALSLMKYPAPILEDLYIFRRWGDDPEIVLPSTLFGGEAPSHLRRLQLTNLTIDEESPLISHHLERLVYSPVSTAPNIIRYILHTATNLRSIELYDRTLPHTSGDIDTSLDSVNLPRLQSVLLYSNAYLAGRILSNLTVPVLEFMVLDVCVSPRFPEADQILLPSLGAVMRQSEMAHGPVRGARLTTKRDHGVERAHLWGWRTPDMRLVNPLGPFQKEQPCTCISFDIYPNGVFKLSRLHEEIRQLPLQSLVTLTIRARDLNLPSRWRQVLRPFESIQVLKLDGTFNALFLGLLPSGDSQGESPPHDDYALPNLVKLIIFRSNINSGGGRLLKPLHGIAAWHLRHGRRLRISFEQCAKYSQAIDDALSPIADVSWDNDRFWNGDEDETWLAFMRERDEDNA